MVKLGSTYQIHSEDSIQGQVITPRQWRTTALILIVSWVAVLAIFWQTVDSMIAIWHRSGTFAHGFLILPISLYLVWTRRDRLAPLIPTPNLWGLPLLAIIGFAWMLGNLTDAVVIQQLAVVAMLQGLVWTVLGAQVTFTLLFPLIFLFFAVPMGEGLVPPLQDFTAFFTVKALQLSGVPVFWEGRLIEIPSGLWEVAETCSGVRYIIVSVTVGCLYASVAYRSWTRRVGFIILSGVVPILANGVRAYGIVLLAHLSNNKIAAGVDHLIYGWFFFAVVMFLLLGVGSRWRESIEVGQPVGVPTVSKNRMGRTYSAKAMAMTAAGGVVLLTLTPIWMHALSNQPKAPAVVRAAAPSVSLPWKPLAQYTGNWAPYFIGANAEVTQSYAAGHRQVHLYLAYYTTQQQGVELINSKNSVADGKQWVRVGEGSRRALVDGRALSVDETIMKSSYRTRLVWSWYWVSGEFTSNPYHAKLLQVKELLLGRPQVAAVIALGVDYDDGHRAEAVHALQDFLSHTSLLTTLNGFSK